MNDLEKVNCNYCGSDNYKVKYVVDGYNYVQCDNCSFVYVNPRLKMDAVLNQYNDDYFRGSGFDKSIDYESEYSTQLQKIDLNDWDISVIKELLKESGNNSDSPKLLDAGCGMGLFLSKAENNDFEVEGLEFSKYAAEFVKSKDIKVQNKSVDDARLNENEYDVIVMKEVIEHVPDPMMTLTKLYKALKPGGLLFMSTGNYDCLERKLRGKNWFYFMPTGHLQVFSNKTMRNYLSKAGFTKINVTNQGDLLHDFMLDNGILDVNKSAPAGIAKKAFFHSIRFVNHYISSGMRIYAFK